MTARRRTGVELRVVHADADQELAGAPPSPRAARSEPALLDSLYHQHARYVASVAARLLGRDGELDDLVQDVFVEALRGLAQLRDPNAIRGWLAKITVRLCVRRLRKLSLLRALHLPMEPSDYEQLAGRSATTEQRVLLAKVSGLLDRLPARTRVIWILRHVLEEPLHRIVELSGCSQSTVQRALRQAESWLEQELRDE